MKGGLRQKDILKSGTEEQPLVSVITVVRNGKKYIEKTIESVLGQSYPNVEYIVVDGNSTDGTQDILKRYESKIDLWVSEPDGGIYFAMNKGIGLTKGSIIGILNADDYYYPDTLKRVVEADKKAKAGVYHGDLVLLEANGEKRCKPDISSMNEKPSIFHPTCFVKKEVYESIGLFDTQFKISSDYEFLLRGIRRGITFHYISGALTAFRPGGMSASCASNIEGYKIMKMHQTGYHRKVIVRGLKCYIKHFLKKTLFLKKGA
jgi:glycosyltransferase involved in cell wall biosynthesis